MQLFTYNLTSTFVAASGNRGGGQQREGMTPNRRDGERIGREDGERARGGSGGGE